jgi:hypothetical protein
MCRMRAAVLKPEFCRASPDLEWAEPPVTYGPADTNPSTR